MRRASLLLILAVACAIDVTDQLSLGVAVNAWADALTGASAATEESYTVAQISFGGFTLPLDPFTSRTVHRVNFHQMQGHIRVLLSCRGPNYGAQQYAQAGG